MDLKVLIEALTTHVPSVLRWGGAIARRLRHYDISIEAKTSGYANTDALTLADLTVQELLVAALRDGDPIFRQCRIEAEESTGDLARFAAESEYTISIDPIDGTKQYRDRTGNGYGTMIVLFSAETVHYSLVLLPELGESGTWVCVTDERILLGEDDDSRSADDVVRSLPAIDPATRPDSKKIYLVGFQGDDVERAQQVTDAGLEGYPPGRMPGNIYDLFARGEFGGSLIHTPNIYDFPASMQIARVLGGDAVWVHDKQPVHFRNFWKDEQANMLRLPGIVACSHSRESLDVLCDVARDWNPNRYAD